MSSIPINANQPLNSTLIDEYNLGKPIAAGTSAIHAAITLPTSGTTVVTTAITNPDVPRCPTITGNASSITATVTLVGTDGSGATLSKSKSMNGTATVAFDNAFKTITSITVGAKNAPGDTVIVGVGAAIGLGVLCDKDCVYAGWLDNVREATTPTMTYSTTVLSANTVTLSSAASMANTKVVMVALANTFTP